MKKEVILIVFVALFVISAYIGLQAYQKQTVITSCETRQSETGVFLDALRANDATLCAQLTPPLRERCKAYVADDSSLCLANDLDCTAIAEHNASKCAEPLCRAMASGNESECDMLTDSADWCKRMVRLEPSPVDMTACQDLADAPN